MNSIILLVVRFLIFLGSIYSKIIFVFFAIIGRVSDEEDIDDLIDNEGLRQKEPHELSMWMKTYFSYVEDIIDYSKDPLMFLYDRKGDCDDFAAFCEVLFKKLGYTNIFTVSTMADNKSGHAVCVVERNGYVYGFGNWSIIFFDNNSIEHIGTKICSQMNGNLWFILKYQEGKFIEGLVK